MMHFNVDRYLSFVKRFIILSQDAATGARLVRLLPDQEAGEVSNPEQPIGVQDLPAVQQIRLAVDGDGA